MEKLVEKLWLFNEALIKAEAESESITGMRHVPTEAFYKARRKIVTLLLKQNDEVVNSLYASFIKGKKETLGTGRVKEEKTKETKINHIVSTLRFMHFIDKGRTDE